MNITAYEAETIINYNEEEKTANIYTHNKPLIKRLEEYCIKFPNAFKFDGKEGQAYNFTINKKYISIRPPKEYTPEQLEKMRERGKRLKMQKENIT